MFYLASLSGAIVDGDVAEAAECRDLFAAKHEIPSRSRPSDLLVEFDRIVTDSIAQPALLLKAVRALAPGEESRYYFPIRETETDWGARVVVRRLSQKSYAVSLGAGLNDVNQPLLEREVSDLGLKLNESAAIGSVVDRLKSIHTATMYWEIKRTRPEAFAKWQAALGSLMDADGIHSTLMLAEGMTYSFVNGLASDPMARVRRAPRAAVIAAIEYLVRNNLRISILEGDPGYRIHPQKETEPRAAPGYEVDGPLLLVSAMRGAGLQYTEGEWR